ncbi:unnamed protein product [Allacma fusca]|uniref:Peptidase S1 domain-containing protein n=1 Tax=Allacma fusca TaxID=39272 RepID=A0A8J2PC02_9HEXA|nr:unnamed protein product [Allacma fusca]
MERTLKVSDGQSTTATEFPYQVQLQTDRGAPFCSGIILTAHIILTAAHCFKSTTWSEVRVLAGKQSQLEVNTPEGSIQKRSLKTRVLSHEEYDNETIQHDIALLWLKESLDFTSYIKNVLIPNNEIAHFLNADAVVSGWGAAPDKKSRPPNLLKANVTVYSDTTCKNKWTTGFLDGMTCAGGQVADACKGDSGGPLTCTHQNSSRKAFACGIVSFGSFENSTVPCGKNVAQKPGIYTNVTKYYKWIMHKSCETRYIFLTLFIQKSLTIKYLQVFRVFFT